MKKFVLGLLIGIMLTLGVTTYAVPEIKEAVFSDITLTVNGVTLDTEVVSVTTTDNPNYMTNYVSARDLAESLGATVTWDGKERAINITSEDTTDDISTVLSAPAAQSTPATETTPQGDPKIPYPVFKVDDTGLTVYDIQNGKFYGILPSEILAALKAKGMVMNNAADYKSLQIVKEGEGIIVSGITPSQYSNKIYIAYDFFTEHIKPLLQ